jgi:Fe2+ transport system protein B
MHTDPGKSYNPDKELTNVQRQKYSDVANKAEEKREQRELYDAALHPHKARAKLIAEAKAKQMEQLKAQKAKRKSRVPELTFWRVLIWSITLGAFWLWILFMFPSN